VTSDEQAAQPDAMLTPNSECRKCHATSDKQAVQPDVEPYPNPGVGFAVGEAVVQVGGHMALEERSDRKEHIMLLSQTEIIEDLEAAI
jgi:hypothetical protein